MKLSEIDLEVCNALDKIRREVLHRKVPGLLLPVPLPADERLTARLLILKAIKEWELVFVREIIEDREAIDAAKAEKAKESSPC